MREERDFDCNLGTIGSSSPAQRPSLSDTAQASLPPLALLSSVPYIALLCLSCVDVCGVADHPILPLPVHVGKQLVLRTYD